MCILATTKAYACIDEGPTYNRYMFSVIPRYQMNAQPPYVYAIDAWWRHYASAPATDGDDADDEYHSYFFTSHNDDIRNAARRKGDKAMLAYISQLNRYLKVSDDVSASKWEYAPLSLTQRRQSLNAIIAAAKAYRGTALRPQYVLLRMRANMLLGNDKANIALWQGTASKLPGSPWRDAMRGIYARALYKTGQWLQACNIYTSLNDMPSLRWALRHYRNLDGIKSVYARQPKAEALRYLVQDFVNNVQETRDPVNPGFESNDEWLREIDARCIQTPEAQSFIQFAQQVVREGKTDTPCLWTSAAALTAHLTGQRALALSLSQKALHTDGAPRMKDNARAIHLLVSACGAQPTPQYQRYVLGELQWLDSMARADRRTPSLYDNHYTDVKERVVHQALIPMMKRAGKRNEALALHAMCDANWADFEATTVAASEANWWTNANPNNHYGPWNDYCCAIDSLNGDQLAAYYAYLTAPHTDNTLEAYVTRQAYSDPTYFADLIGTKLMAEGRFAEAVAWLGQVPVSYVEGQGIAPFMARRSYKVPRWFQRQPVDEYADDGTRVRPTLQRNQKIEFCLYIDSLLSQYGAARPGATREQVAYQLATAWYQASCYGDCWYLTHYYHSVADSARSWEKDFAAEAARYLDECRQSNDMQTQYHALYALAFMPIQPWCTEVYDADYNTTLCLQPQAAQYKALAALAAFARQHPAHIDAYTSRCDVLRVFNEQPAQGPRHQQ